MSAPARDPRGRFFRRLFLGIHVSIAAIFGLLLTWGVWKGLAEIRPIRAQPKVDVSACAGELSKLRQELVERLAGFASAPSATKEGRAYEEWAVRFRHRVASSRQRCAPPKDATAAQSQAVAEAYDALLRSVDLSEIQATHWSRHLGPSLDEAAAAIERAR
ncbi:MAG TPA: hypothetical protein VGD74_06305 [Vulgatibacter sp.]